MIAGLRPTTRACDARAKRPLRGRVGSRRTRQESTERRKSPGPRVAAPGPDFPPPQKEPVTMNPNILHPCGRLFALEQSLDHMAQRQLEIARAIDELAGDMGLSAACETLSMHAIVMAGTAKRLQELRYELSRVLP